MDTVSHLILDNILKLYIHLSAYMPSPRLFLQLNIHLLIQLKTD